MSSATKRQKLAASNSSSLANADPSEFKETSLQTSLVGDEPATGKATGVRTHTFGVDIDHLDDTDSDENDDDDDDEEDDDDDDDDDTLEFNGSGGGHVAGATSGAGSTNGHRLCDDIQEQLAAAGPAGVAAAAAIATARKRKRAHQFETNPSVRKRQQTRLIRKLRACLDEYTMRVGQQAVVLITMPGKAAHNFKVFGAQPLESVIRGCKHEIMMELEQALLEQAPKQFKVVDADRHELPPLVIDGIPTPVEKMTQAQLRAFIPLMLKYSTGRGKPGWGKDSTRPPWWPETLPWANVRSDARDENEKQRISWTTTLRQIVTNCYKFHGRDDLLPKFDESEESLKAQLEAEHLGEQSTTTRRQQTEQQQQQQQGSARRRPLIKTENSTSDQLVYAATSAAYGSANHFVHTIANEDGTVSLIQVDPADAQILTLPDGTQVRAVRLQTLTGADQLCAAGSSQQVIDQQHQQLASNADQQQQQQQLTLTEASLSADGQIILTGEDGTQSCYPMSSLVSIPASVYQQLSHESQLSLVAADGGGLTIQSAEQSGLEAVASEQQQQQQEQEQQVSLVEPSGELVAEQQQQQVEEDSRKSLASSSSSSSVQQQQQQQQHQQQNE